MFFWPISYKSVQSHSTHVAVDPAEHATADPFRDSFFVARHKGAGRSGTAHLLPDLQEGDWVILNMICFPAIAQHALGAEENLFSEDQQRLRQEMNAFSEFVEHLSVKNVSLVLMSPTSASDFREALTAFPDSTLELPPVGHVWDAGFTELPDYFVEEHVTTKHDVFDNPSTWHHPEEDASQKTSDLHTLLLRYFPEMHAAKVFVLDPTHKRCPNFLRGQHAEHMLSLLEEKTEEDLNFDPLCKGCAKQKP